MKSFTVINKCEKIFSQYGIPKELITDNGPEFQRVSSQYHQSNGIVEQSTQRDEKGKGERTLKKAKYDQQDECLALLFLNSQPNKYGISPAKKLLMPQIRTNLPLNPQYSFITETPRPRKTTHSLPNIRQGNSVRVRTDEQNLWDKNGIVIKENKRLRSYNVLKKNGMS